MWDFEAQKMIKMQSEVNIGIYCITYKWFRAKIK